MSSTPVASLSRAALVARFLLVRSLGANPRSRVFYSRVKGEVEVIRVAREGQRGTHVYRSDAIARLGAG